jgi:hypothetical protein
VGPASNPARRWRHHPIQPLRFCVDVLEDLPVDTWQRASGGGAFQALDGGESTLFVHWGESATLEAFRRSMTDLTTRAIDVTQSPEEVLGMAAVRVAATVEHGASVAYRQDAEGGVTHAETPATRYRTEAISFVRYGVPVLVGFRVTLASLREHGARLDHFLASIRPLDG